ncbi:MAG: DUF1775 domain-containing protein [Thermoleophilia bacterium]
MIRRRLGVAVAAVGLGGLTAAGPALAHVQVLPARVAPGDPVLFTVLVPNEAGTPTTTVELRVPDGVVPFSFEPVTGWKRTERRAANGALEGVVWRGSLPVGSFVRFAFLAATPERPGELRWRALQTYADGTVVRWIGAPGSDEPAAVTVVSADAPRQNAGGESGAAEAPAETAAAPADPEPEPAPPAGETARPAPAPAVADTAGLVPLEPEPAPAAPSRRPSQRPRQARAATTASRCSRSPSRPPR